MKYIVKTETEDTGGRCLVDILYLEDGRVICVSAGYVGLYDDVDAIFAGECLNGFDL